MKWRLEIILFAVDVQLKKQEKMDLRNISTRKDFNCQKFEFRWIHERGNIMSHSTNPLKEIKQKHERQEVFKFGLNEMYARSVPDYAVIPFVGLVQ